MATFGEQPTAVRLDVPIFGILALFTNIPLKYTKMTSAHNVDLQH